MSKSTVKKKIERVVEKPKYYSDRRPGDDMTYHFGQHTPDSQVKLKSAYEKGISGEVLTLDECREIANQMKNNSALIEVVNKIDSFSSQIRQYEAAGFDQVLGQVPPDDPFDEMFDEDRGQENSRNPAVHAEDVPVPVPGFPSVVADPWTSSAKSASRTASNKTSVEEYVRSGGTKLKMPKAQQRGYAVPAWATGDLKTYYPDVTEIVSEDMKSSLTPSDQEDFDNLKQSFTVIRIGEPTIVFAIVVDNENDNNNVPSAIRCFGGVPFGGYCHDLGRDSYLIRCVEFFQLGNMPFAFQITMPHIGEWKIKVPIPEKILVKHFAPQYSKMLEEYREKYKKPRFDIHFIQMLGCQG